jgi:hypothetical protein
MVIASNDDGTSGNIKDKLVVECLRDETNIDGGVMVPKHKPTILMLMCDEHGFDSKTKGCHVSCNSITCLSC